MMKWTRSTVKLFLNLENPKSQTMKCMRILIKRLPARQKVFFLPVKIVHSWIIMWSRKLEKIGK